jgi:hypothetical protein
VKDAHGADDGAGGKVRVVFGSDVYAGVVAAECVGFTYPLFLSTIYWQILSVDINTSVDLCSSTCVPRWDTNPLKNWKREHRVYSGVPG